MLCKKPETTIFGLLIVSVILFNTTIASEKEGTHLKFSLEAQPVTVTVSGKVTDIWKPQQIQRVTTNYNL